MNALLEFFAANPLLEVVLRGALGLLGGWLMVNHLELVKKAVPVALLVVNLLVEAFRVMFPALVPPANAAEVAAVAAAALPWWQHILVVVASTAVAVGLHSGPKNAREWADVGFTILRR